MRTTMLMDEARRDESPEARAAGKAAPLRLLLVNDHFGFPGGEIHGVTRWMAHVAPALIGRGIEAQVCILRKWHREGVEELEAAGVSPIILGRAKWDPRAILDLGEIIRSRRIDIVHLMGMKAMVVGRMAAALTGCRSVVHFHDMIEPGRALRLLQRGLAFTTDAALANSPATREFAIEQYGLRPDIVRTLPNALDTRQFAEPRPGASRRIRAEFGIPGHARLIGVIGRVVRVKGQDVLLRAFPAILARCPSAHLLVVGEGPDRAEFTALASRLGIDDGVTFTGHRTDIADILAAVDVVAVPSVWDEAFGLSALEAIAAGKPVVASQSGGLGLTVIEGVTGLQVPRGDEAALADALARMLEDEELRSRLAAGAARHAANFGLEQHVEELVSIYRGLGDTG